MISYSPADSVTAANISSALTTFTTRTKGGIFSVQLPATSVTSAPRKLAARARAMPILPVEWFVM